MYSFCVEVVSDVEIALAWLCCKLTDASCHVFGDISNMVAVRSKYLNGVCVVWVGWLRFKCTDVLTKIAPYVFTMGHACNIELDIVYILHTSILRPHADVIAFVFDAEVLELLNSRLFHGVAIVIKTVEVNEMVRLLCLT